MWLLANLTSSIGSLFGSLLSGFSKQVFWVVLIGGGLLAVYTAGGDAQRLDRLEAELDRKDRVIASVRQENREFAEQVLFQNEEMERLRKQHEQIDTTVVAAPDRDSGCTIDGDFVSNVLRAYDAGG